uniref:Uncharacterized protein n=1 Tax=Anguilla anguilla TaxID=7936 RepID=A0A0E9VLY5_ANGAN
MNEFFCIGMGEGGFKSGDIA